MTGEISVAGLAGLALVALTAGTWYGRRRRGG
jgi:LPXTG-motif cell wall-anchored protein